MVRYLDCDILNRGFVRIRCPECKKEPLLAFLFQGTRAKFSPKQIGACLGGELTRH